MNKNSSPDSFDYLVTKCNSLGELLNHLGRGYKPYRQWNPLPFSNWNLPVLFLISEVELKFMSIFRATKISEKLYPVFVCNGAEFCAIQETSGRDGRSSKNTHGETKRANIFPNRANTYTFMYLSFLTNKNLSTWETSFIQVCTHAPLFLA